MALASGADNKIGAYEFMLATDIEEAYAHQYESLYSEGQEIPGTDHKKNTNPGVRLWSQDSWVSGEGLRYYDPEEPARYWYSNANTRIPGSITSAPDRAQSNNITTNVTPSEAHFVRCGGRVWLFIGRQGFYTTDLSAAWTENTAVSTTAAPAGYTITGACSDGDKPWITSTDGTNRKIYKVSSTAAVTQAVTDRATGGTLYGLAQVEGQVYGWSGGKLFRYDSTAALPIAHGTIDGTGTNPVYAPFQEGPDGTTYNGIAAGETSILFFKASTGVATVFEYKLDIAGGTSSGRSIWNMPAGFTAKQITLSLGVVYLVGEYAGKCALFGMSMVSRQPLFLGYFGESKSITNVRFICPSYGAQVLIGADDGTTSYVFVYDAEEDAFSELDERTIAADGTLLAGLTWKEKRIAAAFATTTTKINRWSIDQGTPTGSWRWESSAWDLGFPQDEKVLLGFHVIQDPTIATGTATVYYQLDEDGTWTNLDSAGAAMTTTGGSKQTYFAVSGASATKKLRTIRFRVDGANGCRVFSATPRAYLNSLQEVWKLTLDLRNESGTLRRPSDRSSRSSTLRNYLHTLVSNRNVVTFLDGRRYKKKSDTVNVGYTSHTVLVEFPKDSIDSASEGRAEIILRSVTP